MVEDGAYPSMVRMVSLAVTTNSITKSLNSSSLSWGKHVGQHLCAAIMGHGQRNGVVRPKTNHLRCVI